jgi:hypothetical protein
VEEGQLDVLGGEMATVAAAQGRAFDFCRKTKGGSMVGVGDGNGRHPWKRHAFKNQSAKSGKLGP